MFLVSKYYFLSNNNLWISSSAQTINSVTISKLFKHLLSSILLSPESKKRCSSSDSTNSPNKRKMVNTFHTNPKSVKILVFLTIIQPKEDESTYRSTIKFFSFKGTLMQIWNSANIFVFMLICWRFHIKTPFTFWVMRTRDMWKFCLQTFKNNRMC